MKVEYKMVELYDEMDVLRNIFDNIELIDPLSGTIIGCNEYKIRNSGKQCREQCLIGRRKGDCVCKQVISTKSAYTTFQFNDDDTYYVMSRPITVKGKDYVMQITSKITSNLTLTGDGPTELVSNITKYNKSLYTDELTGAYNRKFVAENMQAIIDKSILENINICIGCVDIDNFKKFNDKYGHSFGDIVLKSVTQVMMETARRVNDYVIRIGGDEFVIVMQGVDKKQFIRLMNQCCENVDNLRLKTDRGEVARVCISIGCSSLMDDNLITYEQLTCMADGKLYNSKAKGKNCAT